MNRNILMAVVVGALIFGAGIFVYLQSKPADNGLETTTTVPSVIPDSTSSSTTTTVGTELASSSIKEFTITGSAFKFKPTEMRVKVGDKVKVTFRNSGGIHDFVIDEFNVQTKQIQTNQEETVEFMTDQAGSFEYYCSVTNHRAMGMKGTLVVE